MIFIGENCALDFNAMECDVEILEELSGTPSVSKDAELAINSTTSPSTISSHFTATGTQHCDVPNTPFVGEATPSSSTGGKDAHVNTKRYAF